MTQSRYLSAAELYDPIAVTFTRIGNMSMWRVDATATLLPDGRVLIAGGGISGTDQPCRPQRPVAPSYARPVAASNSPTSEARAATSCPSGPSASTRADATMTPSAPALTSIWT